MDPDADQNRSQVLWNSLITEDCAAMASESEWFSFTMQLLMTSWNSDTFIAVVFIHPGAESSASFLFSNFPGYKKEAQLVSDPRFSFGIDCPVPGSLSLHVLWTFPTQQRCFFFFCRGFQSIQIFWETATMWTRRTTSSVSQIDCCTGGVRRRVEKRLKAQGFLLQRLDCLSSLQW